MASKVLLGEELLHPSDYVSAEDLKGRDVTLTIAAVAKEELFLKQANQKKIKPVVSFIERPKKLVLNKTNADTIAKLYGRQAKDWIGKRITLFPTTCKVGRETETCIRIRASVPTGKGTATTPAPQAEPQREEPPPSDDGKEFLDSIGDIGSSSR